MKVIIDEIVSARTISRHFCRERIGIYTIDSDRLPETNQPEMLWLPTPNSLRQTVILTSRMQIISQPLSEIAMLLDVASLELWAEIWREQNPKAVESGLTIPQPMSVQSYVAWATKHQVWP